MENIGDMFDELRNYGYELRNTDVYERFYDKDKKSPTGITYRLLELTRLGKRDVYNIPKWNLNRKL